MAIYSLKMKLMSFFQKKLTKIVVLLASALIFFSCAKTDPVTGSKEVVKFDPKERARDFVEKDGGILGAIGGRNKSTTFEFATSNILWRATLKTLDFLPLSNADYSGGVIIYDWYSEKEEKEQIKISVRFLGNELKSSSIQILGHKKTCDENNKCFTKKIENNISEEIKNSIISTARLIKIEENKKEVK